MHKECKVCKCEYSKPVNRSLRSWNESKFCSKKCVGKEKVGKPSWNKNLVGYMKGRIISKETREKMRRIMTGKHWKMSPEGRKKNSESHKGKSTAAWAQKKEQHWNWQGGKTSEQAQIRASKEYVEWRNSVYRRDFWTCQDCGIKCTPKNIIAHHIKLFSLFPALRFDVDNGVTLCRSCHINLHRDLLITSQKTYTTL